MLSGIELLCGILFGCVEAFELYKYCVQLSVVINSNIDFIALSKLSKF